MLIMDWEAPRHYSFIPEFFFVTSESMCIFMCVGMCVPVSMCVFRGKLQVLVLAFCLVLREELLAYRLHTPD